MTTLLARLSVAFTGILFLLGLTVLWISHRSSQNYFLEFTQQLNAPIAMYMVENGSFLENGTTNTTWLENLAPHVMMINPSVEVYMLDSSGNIIANSPENKQIIRKKVGLKAINDFLQEDRNLPIKGDDPKHATKQSIFSVFPLYVNNEASGDRTIAGYVYAVLGGKQYQSIFDALKGSYSFRILTTTLLCALLLALLSGLMVFTMLTRRLKSLNQRVNKDALCLPDVSNIYSRERQDNKIKLDEIDQLASSYQAMANKLVAQYEELEIKDTNRREFIANISHDLRTPLTTMQSYLETLLLKKNSLSDEEKHAYLNIAFRQSKHLRKLVGQLFTLSKLESGEIRPSIETFSLLELANDTAQEFQIKARRNGIKLYIRPTRSIGRDFDVNADIGMIHRVFENLVENAIRHTAEGGEILIKIDRLHNDHVDVAFIDTGCGMSKEQKKRVTQRYFTESETQDGDMNGQFGLGLTIVNNILSLHDTTMSIESKPGKGTTIRFRLKSSEPISKRKSEFADEELLVL